MTPPFLSNSATFEWVEGIWQAFRSLAQSIILLQQRETHVYTSRAQEAQGVPT